MDTGSTISAEPIKRFRRVFPNCKMFSPDVQLRTVAKEIFKPSAYVKVDVSCDHKTENVKFYLVKENNFRLLYDRDYISEFNIFPHKLEVAYVIEFAYFTDILEVKWVFLFVY